jgi:hypothetical protein
MIKDLVGGIFKFRPCDRITMREMRRHDFVGLPAKEISEADEPVDVQVVDQIVIETGVSRELVMQSLSQL